MEILTPLIINILIMVGIAVLIVKLVRNHSQNNHKRIDQIIQQNNEMQAELKYLAQQIEEISKK